MTLVLSPLLHNNIFTKSYKTQMLIWHYFTKPNINLALFYRAQILFWQLFHKTQMLFWHIFIKFKYYFDICFTYTKSLTHEKYNYSSLKKYLSYKIYKSPCISPMAKLFILQGQPSPRKLNYKAQLDQPSSHTNSNSQRSRELTSQISAQLNSWSPFRSSPNLSNQIRRGHVSIRG